MTMISQSKDQKPRLYCLEITDFHHKLHHHNHHSSSSSSKPPRSSTLIIMTTTSSTSNIATNTTATMKMIIFTFVLLSAMFVQGSMACYFPIEYQGTFLIQTQGIIAPPLPSQLSTASNVDNSTTSPVTYSEVTIEADAIPPWGRCHKRRGNNVILKDSTGAGQDCLRCFHLSMKTPNVIALHTDGLERCYTNEEAARATCPLDKDIQQKKKFKEIILFRKHVPGGLQSTEHVFCPFNGRFRFVYTGNNGQMRCDYGYSEMSNCPHGNALNVKFRKCSFSTMDIHFLCLGDWDSSNNNNERYLALMDLREEPEANRPKYRCGLYKEDHLTGQITVSLSSDSTCSTQLHNSTHGFESMVLSPIPTKRIPPLVESSKCRFPDWMQGRWQRTKVENQQFIYKDEQNQFRTIRSRCIMRQSDNANDRFVVHSVTQCGEQSYSCLWVKRRSPNIMEFKYSDKMSSVMNEKLCDERNFASGQWITEGKEKIVAQSTPCPITGDYTGEVPGASGLCAKVASDCNNPDIMFYSVSSCENRSHVYEEREYRCLGNWEEDGVLYTFTQRRDMPGHQCFAGKVYRNGDEAYIKEAGESCMRGEDEDPLIFGMKITKQASCPRHMIPKPVIVPPPSLPQPSSPSLSPSGPMLPPIIHLPSNHHNSAHYNQNNLNQNSGNAAAGGGGVHTKFSYPPIIKPHLLAPTLAPSQQPPILPPLIPQSAPPSVIIAHHHPSFKPIHHVDRGQNSANNNPNQASHPVYPPFWSYESADLQPSQTTKTHYKPIISDRDKAGNNRDSIGSSASTIRHKSLLSTIVMIIVATIISNRTW